MSVRPSILVVDDEEQVVKSLTNLLRMDYNVLAATHIAEAMDILQREPVQVIMTDQRMPEMSGAELLRNVQEQHPDVIRLLFTGYADVKAIIDAINKGHVYRYINKPWDPDELQTILRGACAHHALIVERRQLVAELQMKNAALKQASELKSAFIRVASHEFRTPVTILSGLCTLARLDQDNPGALPDHLQQIDRAVDRLRRLVNQTISMLSTEQFDAVVSRQVQDVAGVIKTAADDIMPFIGLRHQVFDMTLATDLGTLSIDAEKIRDSLNHLLLNAIKFTPDGGSINLKANRTESGVAIDVSDTGSGIDPESIPRMFEPFFTGFDVSRHSSGQYEHGTQGLGLGLSVVRAFTEMHGGNVSVKSELARGSTFSIFLPEVAEPPVLSKPATGVE